MRWGTWGFMGRWRLTWTIKHIPQPSEDIRETERLSRATQHKIGEKGPALKSGGKEMG